MAAPRELRLVLSAQMASLQTKVTLAREDAAQQGSSLLVLTALEAPRSAKAPQRLVHPEHSQVVATSLM